jgi:fatty acid desaturase
VIAQGIILGSFGLAVTGWLIGAAGHDAGHFAVSRTPWVNDVGVWGMSLLSNPMLWQHQHTYAHHSFTNEFAHDPDLHHFDALLRVHRNFQHNGIYRNQRKFWFVVVAYALVVFGTCVWIPLGMLQKGHLYGVVEWTDRKRPVRALAMSLHYAGYVGLIMLAPFFATAWSTALACVVTHVGTSGLIFALFSQINHLNEASLELDKSQRHKDARSSWAADQVETSNNFAPTSVLWYYLSNGLNLQIEHHLFPGLNHCHLHRIVPVVRQTCEDYGVDYKSWSTWSDLFGAARAWLDKLSESTDCVEPPLLDRKTI